MKYDWDEENIRHIARHGVTPEEAEEVIENEPFDLDLQFINGEERQPSLGETKAGRVLVVIATWREEMQATRVVTAVEPSRGLREKYLMWKGTQYGTGFEDTGVP